MEKQKQKPEQPKQPEEQRPLTLEEEFPEAAELIQMERENGTSDEVIRYHLEL